MNVQRVTNSDIVPLYSAARVMTVDEGAISPPLEATMRDGRPAVRRTYEDTWHKVSGDWADGDLEDFVAMVRNFGAPIDDDGNVIPFEMS